MLLTDEEIIQIIKGVPNRYDIDTQADEMRSIAKAQLKKVVELFKQQGIETVLDNYGNQGDFYDLWQALLKEIE